MVFHLQSMQETFSKLAKRVFLCYCVIKKTMAYTLLIYIRRLLNYGKDRPFYFIC